MKRLENQAAAGETSRRLFVYNGGFLTQRRMRRILELSGYDVSLGKPSPGDLIGVWGQSPTSWRGEAVSDKTTAPVLRVEDAFLRSVLPGRDGEPLWDFIWTAAVCILIPPNRLIWKFFCNKILSMTPISSIKPATAWPD